ncbi:MAG TPA: fatty acid--CoA ligase family protein [Candidatus Margulisiibacteriota bacterium]|nr:fatty acid--CoA ligase family protein [Candidatus Margulisiibacteriota bacterium]
MKEAFWLIERLNEFYNRTAIVWNGKSYNYLWLTNRIAYWLRVLSDKDIRRGEVVAFSADYSPDSCSLLIALASNDNIIVPLSGQLKEEGRDYLRSSNAGWFFVMKDSKSSIRKLSMQRPHPLVKRLQNARRPGIVLFSSGSTGRPKAILHDFFKLLERHKQRRKKLVTIPFLFLDHIGGLNTLFYTLSNGGTLVILKERSPRRVCEAVERYRVELLPVSPTFLNLLLISNACQDFNLGSLKIISYGTEVMPEETLKRLHKLLPRVKLLQTYGLSELGILFSKSRGSSSLWMKVGGEGFKIKIIDSELWIKSEFSMLGYLNAPNPFREAGWFNTHDLVVKGKNGYLKVLGRSTDIINVGGQKVFPSEVENVILKVPGVKDVTVFAEKNPLLGSIVAARVCLKEPAKETPEEFKRRMWLFCKKIIPAYKIPVRLIITDKEEYGRRFKKIRRRV